jgi:CTP:molybdopterin cytidylyltransferase MocA
VKPFVGAVVLAAGASSRMGRCKALLAVDGVPMVRLHVLALSPWVDRVVVVVGFEGAAVAETVNDLAEVAVQRRWRSSPMSSSVRLGLRSLPPGRVLVTPVDVPPVDAATARALAGTPASAVPVDGDGRAGHPVAIDDAVRKRLARAPRGLSALLTAAARVPGGSAWDWDTPDAFEAWVASHVARFATRRSRPRRPTRAT